MNWSPQQLTFLEWAANGEGSAVVEFGRRFGQDHRPDRRRKAYARLGCRDGLQ